MENSNPNNLSVGSAPLGAPQDAAKADRNINEVLRIAKVLSSANVKSHYLFQSSQQSQQEEMEANAGNSREECRKRLDVLLNSLDENSLKALIRHSYTGNSTEWNADEDPTVAVVRTILGGSSTADGARVNAAKRREVTYTKVISLLNEGNVLSNKAAEKCIAILMSELDNGLQLRSSFPSLIGAILGAVATDGCKCLSFELLPALWGRILSAGSDETYDGLSGYSYTDTLLAKLCKSKWSNKATVKIMQTLRDIPGLSQEQATRVIRRASKQLREIDLQELPPFVYQMLLFTSKYKKSIGAFWEGITSFFEDAEASSEASSSAGKGQLRHVEGTVLLHFNFSIKQDQMLGDALVSHFKLQQSKATQSSFTTAIMLSIARIRRFRDPIVSGLYDAVYKSYLMNDRRALKPWINEFLKSDSAVTDDDTNAVSLRIIVQNGVMGWDHVVPSLLSLAFRMFECGAGNAMAKNSDLDAMQSTARLGFSILKSTFQRYGMARPEILEAIFSSIGTQGASALRYILLLRDLSNDFPNLLLDHTPTIKLMIECIGRLPPYVARLFVKSIKKLISLRQELQDFSMLILRKAIFNRDLQSRQAAVEGLLQLILISKSLRAKQEIAGCLKRALSQEYAVKKVLYAGIIRVFQSSSEDSLPFPLLRVLWRHFQKYGAGVSGSGSSGSSGSGVMSTAQTHVSSTPFRIDACISSNGQIIEPLPILLKAIAHCAMATAAGSSKHKQEAKSMVASLDRLAIEFSNEDCEPEDFGLDKNCEFHGVSLEARKNFHRSHLLNGICEALTDYIGRNMRRKGDDKSILDFKHLERVMRFKKQLMKISASAIESKGSKASSSGGKKKQSIQQRSGGESTISSEESVLSLLKLCQEQQKAGEWFVALRSQLIASLLKYSERLSKSVMQAKKNSLLTSLDDFSVHGETWGDVVEFCVKLGPCIIKEFEKQREGLAKSEDVDEQVPPNLRKAKGKQLAKVMSAAQACIQIFAHIVKTLDLLPDSNAVLGRLLKRTFSKGSEEEKELDEDGSEDGMTEGSNTPANSETMTDGSSTPANSETENACFNRGFNCIRRLTNFLLQDENMVQIALVALEVLQIVSKHTAGEFEAKQTWIEERCNGDNIANKAKKNNRVIAELLNLRYCIAIEGARANKSSVLGSTCSLSTSISAESKYFDGTELTQNEGAESTIRILSPASVSAATRIAMNQITTAIEDSEWAIAYFRNTQRMLPKVCSDDVLDDEEDDGSRAQSLYSNMVSERKERIRKLNFISALASETCQSLRPLINIDTDVILKEKILRIVIRFFKLLNSYLKVLLGTLKSDRAILEDSTVIKSIRDLVGHVSSKNESLTSQLYLQLTAFHQRGEMNQQDLDAETMNKLGQKKSKQVMRQSKIIPEVIYAIETFEASLLKFSKLESNGIPTFKFEASVVRATARDFRLVNNNRTEKSSSATGRKRQRVSKREKEESSSDEEEDTDEGEEEEEGEGDEDLSRSRRRTMLVATDGEDSDSGEDEHDEKRVVARSEASEVDESD